MRFRVSLLAASLLLLSPAARAGTPLGGITVAVSPDGKRLVAGGDSRTLVVLDPETLEVKDRTWIETDIVRMAFNQKGTLLAVESTEGKVTLFDTATWKKKLDLGKREIFAMASKADVLAGYDTDYNSPTIHLHSMADGTVKAQIPLPAKGIRYVAYGINADATRLAVITEGKDDPAEKKVEYNDIPKDLKDLPRDEFVQHNDGKTSTFYLLNAADGKVLLEKKIFYTTYGGTILFKGEDAILLSITNVNARISPKGDVTLFKLAPADYSAYGASADQGTLMAGGSRFFGVASSATLQVAKGEFERLPGWPEYCKGFSGTADGKGLYVGTSAYRVVRIGADGKVIKAAPIK